MANVNADGLTANENGEIYRTTYKGDEKPAEEWPDRYAVEVISENGQMSPMTGTALTTKKAVSNKKKIAS